MRSIWIAGGLFLAGLLLGWAGGWLSADMGASSGDALNDDGPDSTRDGRTGSAPRGTSDETKRSDSSQRPTTRSADSSRSSGNSSPATNRGRNRPQRNDGTSATGSGRRADKSSAAATQKPGADGLTTPAGARLLGFIQEDNARLARFLADGYLRLAEEKIPADRLAALEADVRIAMNRELSKTLQNHVKHEQLRAELGELTDPVEVTVQISTAGSGDVPIVSFHSWGVPFKELDGPLDLTTATPWKDNNRYVYRKAGVVPPGHVFVIEEVELAALMGTERRAGTVDLNILSSQRIRVLQRHGPLAGVLRGRVFVRPLEESRVRLGTSAGKASAIFRGRLVTSEEAKSLEEEPFELVPEGRVGFLHESGSFVAQFSLDGKRGTVPLTSGGKTRLTQVDAGVDLWAEATPEKKGGHFSIRDDGAIPPGRLARIVRVDHRSRLAAESGRSAGIVLRVKGKQIVNADARNEQSWNGSWSGEVTLRQSDLSGLSIQAWGDIVGEVTVHYELVDAP